LILPTNFFRVTLRVFIFLAVNNYINILLCHIASAKHVMTKRVTLAPLPASKAAVQRLAEAALIASPSSPMPTVVTNQQELRRRVNAASRLLVVTPSRGASRRGASARLSDALPVAAQAHRHALTRLAGWWFKLRLMLEDRRASRRHRRQRRRCECLKMFFLRFLLFGCKKYRFKISCGKIEHTIL